jgi:hypothetical protein
VKLRRLLSRLSSPTTRHTHTPHYPLTATPNTHTHTHTPTPSSFNRPRKQTLKTGSIVAPKSDKAMGKILKKKDKSYKLLAKRMERQDKLDTALLHMETLKNVSGKGRKRKVKNASDGMPAEYKWKKERKR